MIVSGTTDVGMVDPDLAGAARPGSGRAIELLLEDGADRAIVARADLQRAQRGRIDAGGAIVPRQPQDAETRAIAMFGVRPVGEYLLAQQRHRRPQPSGFVEQAFGGPVRVAPVAGGHMVGDAGVAAVARPSWRRQVICGASTIIASS